MNINLYLFIFFVYSFVAHAQQHAIRIETLDSKSNTFDPFNRYFLATDQTSDIVKIAVIGMSGNDNSPLVSDPEPFVFHGIDGQLIYNGYYKISTTTSVIRWITVQDYKMTLSENEANAVKFMIAPKYSICANTIMGTCIHDHGNITKSWFYIYSDQVRSWPYMNHTDAYIYFSKVNNRPGNLTPSLYFGFSIDF